MRCACLMGVVCGAGVIRCTRGSMHGYRNLKLTLGLFSFTYFAVCLTIRPKPLPKRALHIVRSRASSFKCEYPLLFWRSTSSFLVFFLLFLSLLTPFYLSFNNPFYLKPKIFPTRSCICLHFILSNLVRPFHWREKFISCTRSHFHVSGF